MGAVWGPHRIELGNTALGVLSFLSTNERHVEEKRGHTLRCNKTPYLWMYEDLFRTTVPPQEMALHEYNYIIHCYNIK